MEKDQFFSLFVFEKIGSVNNFFKNFKNVGIRGKLHDKLKVKEKQHTGPAGTFAEAAVYALPELNRGGFPFFEGTIK